ncbi:uncharacterized protein (DUF885 family) [Nocardiopsis sp. Huas11]|uniref:DUF885 domain-containing protein n=1 Tax=Nocardiopsis sp. Huas11 TaxID=2183912 RepID=UPI000EB1B05E|nr:DUF885 domain-containing protein [Nocardiopsis sp. Huas11]RKS09926.1 uncharacterized protein (DUF885 family) [Nocardiopsis sp. Huas11]
MTQRFRRVAERVLDALLSDAPEWALELGDARGAARLSDHSVEADAARMAMLADALGSLDEIDGDLIPEGDLVDLEILRSKVSADLWHLTELRPHTWNPLLHSPGEAVLALVERDALPLPERLEALAGRCGALPDYLATARARLDEGPGMPRVHVETALAQLAGARELLTTDVPALAERDPGLRGRVEEAARTGLAAVEEYEAWLRSRLETATADPRLGERDFAAQLWYTLDSEISPEALLVRAESDLLATEEAIAEAAAEYEGRPRRPGQVAEVLSSLAAATATDTDIVRPSCSRALEHLDARVRELGLVTVHDDPVRIIAMPRSRQGVAVAYCDPPGPLDPAARDQPTFVAVAPPPPDWPAERRASFFREYNGAMLRNLMVHEAVPGHALQLAHAARHDGGTRVRNILWSGTFVEGWAVYTEELMARHGWNGGTDEASRRDDLALRLVQLKMRLRVILNAVLDVRLHTRGLTESEAIALLTERGHQEEGEAVGKWRRAQLTSAQLSTYYVGYAEVADLARDLSAARPGDDARRVHDAMLAHGSPPPRHLRTLLGL